MNNREIDRLVAEKVMNAKFNDGEIFKIILENGNKYTTFSPSTDIKHAWEVVDKLRDIRIFSIADAEDENGNKVYFANFQYYDGFHGINYESYHETAPLAICKAALKTVGIEVDE